MMQLDLFSAPACAVHAQAPTPMPAPAASAVVQQSPQQRCRVGACSTGEPATSSGHCPEHDTEYVREMPWPHCYVFEGRRIVLNSSPWAELAEVAGELGQQPGATLAIATASPSTSTSDGRTPSPDPVASVPVPFRCWHYCGRDAAAAPCHPASVWWAVSPAAPCLACGRPTFACRAVGLCCSEECSEILAMMRAGIPAAELAAVWLDEGHWEDFQERAAMLAEGERSERAERQALLMVWRQQMEAA